MGWQKPHEIQRQSLETVMEYPHASGQAEDWLLGISSQEKDVRILVGNQLKMALQNAHFPAMWSWDEEREEKWHFDIHIAYLFTADINVSFRSLGSCADSRISQRLFRTPKSVNSLEETNSPQIKDLKLAIIKSPSYMQRIWFHLHFFSEKAFLIT